MCVVNEPTHMSWSCGTRAGNVCWLIHHTHSPCCVLLWYGLLRFICCDCDNSMAVPVRDLDRCREDLPGAMVVGGNVSLEPICLVVVWMWCGCGGCRECGMGGGGGHHRKATTTTTATTTTSTPTQTPWQHGAPRRPRPNPPANTSGPDCF